MEIKRDAYLEQLKIRKDNGMICQIELQAAGTYAHNGKYCLQ